jgi:hypothetical protein
MNMYVVKNMNNNNNKNTSGCGFKFQLPKTLIQLSCKMWVLAMVYLVAALFAKTLVLFLSGLVLAFLLIKFGRVTSNECST